MTGEKVKEVIRKYEAILDNVYGVRATRNMEATSLAERLDHLGWMCEQVNNFVDEGRMDKAFRWLGFLQGAFWAYGIQSIEESKKDNTPEGVEFDKQKV